MTRGDVLASLWLCAVLGAVLYVSGVSAGVLAGRSEARHASQPTAAAGLADASGQVVPVRPYRRIASVSGYADGLLFALAEPERLVALSQYGHDTTNEPFRYGARPLIATASDVEALLALRVELLIVNHLGPQSELARVRDLGIAVFDLGEMRGLPSLERHLLALATLLGDRSRGERLWQRWSAQLSAVARDVPKNQRRSGLYVASYAGKLYGGTRGTSYHDVLVAAGMDDRAADRYRDWPQYDPEELLRMDPALLVTDRGMGALICEDVWLRALRACQRARAGVIELPTHVIGDSGLGLLDAAELLHARVYPPAR